MAALAEQEGGPEEVEAPAAQAVQAAKEVGSVVPGVEVASRVGHSRSNPTHSCHATMHTVGGPALASRAHAALCDAHREHASLSNGARAAPAFIVLGARTAVVAKSVDG